MKKITAHVDPEAAQVYREASPELRAKMNALISLQILEAEKHPLSCATSWTSSARRRRIEG